MPFDKSQRVLVVEDEALIALDLEGILEDLGHEVVGVAGGIEQALELLDSLDPPPDIAIVDANLGGRSSRPVVDALQERDVTVLVASGYGARELNGFGFDSPSINKPYTARDIEVALSRHG